MTRVAGFTRMKKQLPQYLRRQLREFYGTLSFMKQLNEDITCLATAENMPRHIGPMQVRVVSLERYRKDLEARLDEFGFDYRGIKKKYFY
jgi:hypothetical protein